MIVSLEHPPTYTAGRRFESTDIGAERLRSHGADVFQVRNLCVFATAYSCFKTDRGGQITFHGPGQLVLYPILDLRRFKVRNVCI